MNAFPWYAAEQFLLVSEAGGLSAAARFGRTGLSQPALSAQMAQLEAYLGRKLFHRKPFALTPEGKVFQEEALRMRARMARIRDTVAAGDGMPLRVAASDVIIRDHLPSLLKHVGADVRTRMVLREAPSQELPGLVRDGEVDLAIGLLSPHVSTGGHPLVEKIAKLPFVLHVPPSHARAVGNWMDLRRMLRKGECPGLIALPENNLLMRHLSLSFRKMAIEWPTTVEVSSLGHVPAYVKLDFGFGFGLAVPGSPMPARVLEVPAERIPPITLGVWHGETMDPPTAQLLSLIRSRAGEKSK